MAKSLRGTYQCDLEQAKGRTALPKRTSKTIFETMKPTVTADLQSGIESNVGNSGDADNVPFDPIAVDAAMKKWRVFLHEQLLADGFTTTEALMNDFRSR